LLGARNNSFSLFCGFFLMILGASVAERITFFSAALLIAVIFDMRDRGIRMGALALPASLGLLAVVLGLMLMIDFKLNEFWHDFHFCAAGKNDGIAAAVKLFFHDIAGIRWPLVFMGLIFVLLVPWLRSKEVARTVLLLAGAFMALIFIGGLGHGAIWYVILILLLTGSVGLRLAPPSRTILIQLLVASVLLVANSRYFIYAAGILGGKIKPDLGEQAAAAQQFKATPEHPVLIDSNTARFLFDYRLAPNFSDFYFSAPFPMALPTDAPLRPDDTYLIGADAINLLDKKTHLNQAVPVWKPVGNKKTFIVHPRWVYMIHPDDLSGPPGKS
jgi:hypothetical protein